MEHRSDADLEAALRAAEKAVQDKLDYKIALTEKPLYEPSCDNTEDAGSLLDSINDATWAAGAEMD